MILLYLLELFLVESKVEVIAVAPDDCSQRWRPTEIHRYLPLVLRLELVEELIMRTTNHFSVLSFQIQD